MYCIRIFLCPLDWLSLWEGRKLVEIGVLMGSDGDWRQLWGRKGSWRKRRNKCMKGVGQETGSLNASYSEGVVLLIKLEWCCSLISDGLQEVVLWSYAAGWCWSVRLKTLLWPAWLMEPMDKMKKILLDVAHAWTSRCCQSWLQQFFSTWWGGACPVYVWPILCEEKKNVALFLVAGTKGNYFADVSWMQIQNCHCLGHGESFVFYVSRCLISVSLWELPWVLYLDTLLYAGVQSSLLDRVISDPWGVPATGCFSKLSWRWRMFLSLELGHEVHEFFSMVFILKLYFLWCMVMFGLCYCVWWMKNGHMYFSQMEKTFLSFSTNKRWGFFELVLEIHSLFLFFSITGGELTYAVKDKWKLKGYSSKESLICVYCRRVVLKSSVTSLHLISRTKNGVQKHVSWKEMILLHWCSETHQ